MKARFRDKFGIRELPAQSSSYERNKDAKLKVCKIKSPDTDRMLSIHVPSLRATFYPANKRALKRKTKQLKSQGIEFVIK